MEAVASIEIHRLANPSIYQGFGKPTTQLSAGQPEVRLDESVSKFDLFLIGPGLLYSRMYVVSYFRDLVAYESDLRPSAKPRTDTKARGSQMEKVFNSTFSQLSQASQVI